MKEISIVIPVYNRALCISRCLDSVKEQSFTNWECILIDDGSTDDSLAVCRKYTAADSRFSVYSQQNKGVSEARNAGIGKAGGKYLAFIDSDDWVASDYLQRLHEVIEGSDLALCGITEQWTDGRYEELYEPKKTLRMGISATDTLIRMYEKRILTGPVNKLYVRDVIEKKNIRFTPDLHLGEDIVFNFSYLAAIERIEVIPQCLYHVEKQEGSLSSRIIVDRFKPALVVWRSLYDFFMSKQMYTKAGEVFVGIDYCRNVCNCIGMVQHLHGELGAVKRYEYITGISRQIDAGMIDQFMYKASCRLPGWLIKKKMYVTLWLLYELKALKL